ncbi:hypothetical protein Y032_0002g571 [Ancylostoma ceylanicum]|nr:hypothetical protein Y032_0002g571 [Ancylostoma ceylanicum]
MERPLANFFRGYGAFVSRHPFPFIAFPVLITLYLSTGFFTLTPQTDAIYLYTPTDAPSKTERQIIHDLWPLGEDNYVPGRAVTQSREAQVTVVAKNGGNILLPEYARSIKRLDMYIQNRIKVRFRNHTYTYRELCLRWKNRGCPGNNHIQIISELYNHGINITYPTFRIGSSGYLGAGIGGVSLSKDDNGTVILASARAWLMVYQLKFFPINVSYVSGIWEKTFKLHMDNYPEDPFISLTYFHSQTLAEELKRNADSLAPRFIFAFVILVIFAVICSMVTIKGTFYFDWVLSKPILSVFGVINAGMGIASAMGGLILLDVQYNDIVAVMPFLVVAVGTDNMFLMVAAVKRTCRAATVEQRIGECMADAAVSILITALTDAFSFGVGTITTIPAVQIFCIYTCCALVLTFLYQITFFCALLSLATKWEAEGRHCLWLTPTIAPKLASSPSNRLLWLGSRPHPDPKHASNIKHCSATKFFQNWYAPILMQPAIKALAGLWYCIYVGFAIYGCMHLREGLEPVNLLVDDSYAKPHYLALEQHFWHYGATLQWCSPRKMVSKAEFEEHHRACFVSSPGSRETPCCSQLIKTAINVSSGDAERQESLKQASNILRSNGYQARAKRIKTSHATSSTKPRAGKHPLCLPFITDRISSAIRQCFIRAQLDDNVVLVNIPNDNITRQLVQNRLYDRAFVSEDCVVCPHGKTGDCAKTGVIYEIECLACHAQYIGETGRPLYVRVNEHLASKKRESLITPLGKHRKEDHGGADFNIKCTILALEAQTSARKTLEAFWICKRNPRMNSRNEHLAITSDLMPFLSLCEL